MKHPLLLIICCLLIACNEIKEENTQENQPDELLSIGTPEVKVRTIKKNGFKQELLSTGKLHSEHAVELSFRVSGELEQVMVKNGDRVKQGTLLAKINPYRLQVAYEQALEGFRSARLKQQDLLLSRGYALKDTTSLPEQTLQTINTLSGFELAKLNLGLAINELNSTQLMAPIDGIVANLEVKNLNTINNTNRFCTILDNRSFEVTFTVLESELAIIKQGDEVNITPYALPGEQFPGRISEINPTVNENGQVQVKASVKNNGKLFDGMNAQVSLFRIMPNMLVVPKSAIVLRNGREVVFTYKNNKAYWNYVTTGQENATEKVIVEGINHDDIVIIEGNFNLAHEVAVQVIE